MRPRTGITIEPGLPPFPVPERTGSCPFAGGSQVDLAPVLAGMCGGLPQQIAGAERFPIRAELHPAPLSGRTAAHLKRVFAELFRNALMHAYAPGVAGPVGVFLWRASGATRLLVTDAGLGIATEPGDGGIARARTAMVHIGGSLTCEPGLGTTWYAVVSDGAVPPVPRRTLH